MKRVLCYGDSNTWGFIPATGERYPETVRWTGLLQTMLGANHQIVEEGLNGRTTVWEDPVRDFMNSAAYLGPCLLSQFPLDLIVFMLGTNDLKQRFHLNAWSIAEGLRQNLRLIARSAEQGGVQKPAILFLGCSAAGRAEPEGCHPYGAGRPPRHRGCARAADSGNPGLIPEASPQGFVILKIWRKTK